MADLPPSLSSDDEVPPEEESDDDQVDEDFQFGGILGEDAGSSRATTAGWSYQTALDGLKESVVPRLDVADLIAAKRSTLRKQEPVEDEASSHEGDDDDGNDDSSSSSDSSSDNESHMDMEEDVIKTRAGQDQAESNEDDDDQGSDDESVDDDVEEAAKAAAFFDDESSPQPKLEVFSQLALSRPILRGVAAMGFVKPTPIQSAVIPLTLAGRDVCASAVTGSGKTAAFLLPVMERLLHRYSGRTKAVILTPTRELAAQCLGMMTTFSQFTKLRASLIVGGAKNVASQAAELRTRPDVVVATPGRLLDHVTNSPGVTLEEVEFLILDEADRLLDLGFQDEVHEIIKQCPVERQTLLFSATMNTKVDDLIRLSLKRPIRVRISDKERNSAKDLEVAPRLEQEFVRVRAGNEGVNREAMLLALLSRTFASETIVFFDTKAAAHRLMILCGLCGIKCTELHGNLSQQQRLQALEAFRKSQVDVLLATDLAARGLDIDSVKTVINFEMPSQVETYIHRIGRSARAGRSGRSCTLIGEGRRHLMKELIKDAEAKSKKKNGTKKNETGVIRSRAIPPAVISHFAAKIQSLEPHLEEVLQAEAVARMDRVAEMEVVKAQNLIEHSDEIKSRPQREWFASSKQKKMTKKEMAERQKEIEEKAGTGVHRMNRKKRRKRQAMAVFDNARVQEGDDGSGDETPRAPAKKLPNIKAAARKAKRKDEERSREFGSKILSDTDPEKVPTPSKKKRKGVKGTDAAGDSSLFDEDKVTFSKKSTAKKEPTVAKSTYAFRGYDPDKKLGKNKGKKAFKSRAKYRRK